MSECNKIVKEKSDKAFTDDIKFDWLKNISLSILILKFFTLFKNYYYYNWFYKIYYYYLYNTIKIIKI